MNFKAQVREKNKNSFTKLPIQFSICSPTSNYDTLRVLECTDGRE